MMYQDGSVSKNIRYQETCVEKFREASNKNKLEYERVKNKRMKYWYV